VALVERATHRDQVAFAALYDQFLGPVYRYVFYRVSNRVDAEDLSEQVFLQAWAAIDRFRWQGKPFLAWLYALAHNLVIDWRRRAKPAQSLDDGEYPLDPESPSAARDMTQWLDAELLAAAMGRLTPEQEQVITLKFIEGFDTRTVPLSCSMRCGQIAALPGKCTRMMDRSVAPGRPCKPFKRDHALRDPAVDGHGVR
jgi:RNA polymerase sigma-70 factor, ECF subfamily